MKNNQFKKILRERVESLCEEKDLNCAYVDHSNNSRMMYIYRNADSSPLGTIDLYLTEKDYHMYASASIEQPAGLVNHNSEVRGSYLTLKNAFEFLESAIDSMITAQEMRELTHEQIN